MTEEVLRVIFASKGVVRLDSVRKPPVNGGYTVSVEASSTLINAGTDLGVLHAAAGYERPYPVTPTAVMVGRVRYAGPAVASVRPNLSAGQRVLLRHRHMSCVSADVLSTPVVALPDELSDREALLAGQAVIALAAIRVGGVKLGTSVAVIGLGLVGQLVARMATAAGARPVLVWDHHDTRSETAALDRRVFVVPPDQLARLQPEVVFVAAPTSTALQSALDCIGQRGTVVLVAASPGPTPGDIAQLILRRDIRIVGAHETKVFPADDLPGSLDALNLCIELFKDGTLAATGLGPTPLAANNVAGAYLLLHEQKEREVAIALDWR